jgi:tRNA threonylcarbamoyladenosine biosynthesis protein TsaB
MYVLGIDTSTLVATAAIIDAERVIVEAAVHTRRTHSERLMPTIERLIAEAELTPKDLQGIAVSIGPGSFTGLRIGITTAKAMAYALGIPVVGVPTLDALATQLPFCNKAIYPILDAQKKNVYTAPFTTSTGRPHRLGEYQVVSIEQLLLQLHNGKESVILCGETKDFAENIAQLASPHIEIAPVFGRMPRGAVVANLGRDALINGGGEDPQTLAPFYIRRSEAEVLWEQRQSGGGCNGD